jgi:hypothetical protein
MYLNFLKNISIVLSIFTFASCSQVEYNAAFTTPKDNIENVPKILSSFLFNDPKLSKVKICEFNSQEFMALIQSRAQKSNMSSVQVKNLSVKTYELSEIKGQKVAVDQIKYFKNGKTKYIQYSPKNNEAEIVTFFQLFTILNKIKHNKNIEVYSQTGNNYERTFIILYK